MRSDQSITFSDVRNPRSLTVTLKPAGQFEPNTEDRAVLAHFGVPGETVNDCRFGVDKCVEYEMGKEPKSDQEVFILWEQKSRTTVGPNGEGLPVRPQTEQASWPFFAATGFFATLAGVAFWRARVKQKP
jgi:hypothetical protein